MRMTLSLLLVAALAACAKPSGSVATGEKGGRAEVVADFTFQVRENLISGRYNPNIFEKDRVLGHVRRACSQFAIVGYREARSADRVNFEVRCTRRALADAQGAWVVERAAGGHEQARRL